MNWSQFPFVRLILPFVLGIVVAFRWERDVSGMLEPVVGLLVIYTCWVLVLSRNVSHRYRWVSGVLIFWILFVCGLGLSRSMLQKAVPGSETTGMGESLYIVELLDDPVPTARSYKVVGRIVVFRDSSGWRNAEEDVMLYFEKQNRADSLCYGDRLLISCSLNPVKGPSNPGEFNYKRFLKFQGIYRSAYVKNEYWMETGINSGIPLLRKSRELRRKLLFLLRQNGIDGKEYGLAAAILLGYDASLDDNQRRQFAGAGAMHILCVSGLHVGIIAMVMSQILFFLNRNKWGRILKLILLVGFIWSYAAITGFSPSVLRAATMFTFIYAGRSFRRSISIYNMLAASAFVLLLIEPRLLVQVGFQLSYLAVTGIVLLFKPIYGLFPLLKGFADKIWQLTAVSVAATATTFPLSLFYFHQFPNLFWVTNLVAIPAAFIIVYLGMGVLLFSFVPVVSNLLGKILSFILYGLNKSVELVEGLPMATTKNIYLAPAEFALLLAFVITVTALILLRKRSYSYLSLILLVFILVLTGFRKTANSREKAFIVYHISGHSAYEFVWGQESVFLCDSSLLKDVTKIGYAVQGFRIRQGIRKTETIRLDSAVYCNSFLHFKEGLIFFGNRIILLPHSAVELQAAKVLPRIDLAILSQRIRPRSNDPLDIPPVKLWVLDASIPPWNRSKWKTILTENGWSTHDVNGVGAFVYPLE